MAAIALPVVSCTTSYDAYGNPQQTVDPATATAGIAAAGLLGYALSKDNNRNRYDHYHHHRGHGYYGRRGGYNYY
ncbi:MAG: hypothetical protein H7Y36_07215 [Armatimonadetes bacterium]|nr:hypothetical protein [Akkermansiaceae bacterium]